MLFKKIMGVKFTVIFWYLKKMLKSFFHTFKLVVYILYNMEYLIKN